jgi:hypothetical protein
LRESELVGETPAPAIAPHERLKNAAALAGEVHVNVPWHSTPRVQEVHRTLAHVTGDLVERSFVDR